MSVRSFVVSAACLSLLGGTLTLSHTALAQETSVEQGAFVIESNNRRSIVVLPGNGVRWTGRVPGDTSEDRDRGDAGSSAKIEVVPVKADLASSKEKGNER
jgi:hypothetical protein